MQLRIVHAFFVMFALALLGSRALAQQPVEHPPSDAGVLPQPTEEDPSWIGEDDLPRSGAETDRSTPDASGAEAPASRIPPANEVAPAASTNPAELATTGADGASPTEEDDDDDDVVGRIMSGFAFGSYGRVIAASDLRGGTGGPTNLVAHGPRVDESDAYVELELRREDTFSWAKSKIVASLAVFGPLFHFDGEPDEHVAMRNLFLDVSDLGELDGLSLWAGSRMWRGDDIYLLNTWNLDNLNLLGGGTSFTHDMFEIRAAGGLSRPSDPFQTQVIDAVPDVGFLPEEVYVLDRPRLVLALKGTYFPLGRVPTGLKLTLYGEHHSVAAGERRTDIGFVEQLPADDGYVLGAQVGGWIVDNKAFLNLFFRYARGLGATNPLGVPFRTGSVIDTGRAEELMVSLSGNYEIGWAGVQVGGYFRRFRDADPSVLERSALAEGTLDVRPYVWFNDWLGVAADFSVQAMQMSGLDPATGNIAGGSIWKIGVLPFISPFGRGTYTRPHLRIIYSVAVRDEGAMSLLNDMDPRSTRDVEHFLGVGAEWWIDSSSYSAP